MRNIPMKNIKQRRRTIALIVIFLFLFLIIFLVLRKADYELEYEIDGYQITESYQKEADAYLFSLAKEDKNYATILENQSFSSRKLIYQIEEYQNENETCIVIYSNQLRFNPLCQKDGEQISYHLVSDTMKENFEYKTLENTLNEYESIKVNQYFYANYYIWNYHGFYHINEGTKETINLFSKDIYDPKLIYQSANLLFIPDYDANYYFEKAYILNMDTGKYETWNLENRIYFDSVILGEYDNEIYLVDKHEKKEWKINLSKKKLEQVGSESKGGVTYQNGFQDVSMTKLINQDMNFTDTTLYDYKIDNGLFKTFQNYQIRIKNDSPNQIIKKESDRVYYLIGDTLYCYNEDYGEIEIMSYFEWNFNASNVIFID